MTPLTEETLDRLQTKKDWDGWERCAFREFYEEHAENLQDVTFDLLADSVMFFENAADAYDWMEDMDGVGAEYLHDYIHFLLKYPLDKVKLSRRNLMEHFIMKNEHMHQTSHGYVHYDYNPDGF